MQGQADSQGSLATFPICRQYSVWLTTEVFVCTVYIELSMLTLLMIRTWRFTTCVQGVLHRLPVLPPALLGEWLGILNRDHLL